MDKIIRADGILTEKQYKNIELFLKNNGKGEFHRIYINLKLKDKKDSNLIMEIEQEYRDEKILFSIKYKGKIILKENFLFIENIIGLLTTPKGKPLGF